MTLWFTPRWRLARPGPSIATQLAVILERLDAMTQALDALKTAVAAEETQIGAVIAYLQGVPALIAEAVANANGDAAQMDADLSALQTQIARDTASLTSAVQAAPAETAGNVTAAPSA